MKHPKYGDYFLNIEAQKGSVSYPLSNRIDIYLANGICMQSYGKMETTYKELKPFVSIWLIMNGPSKFKNKIKIFSLRENKIDGNQSTEDFNSKMKAILVYIGKEIDEKNQLLALFGTLFSMDLSYEKKIKQLNEIDPEFLDKEIEKEVNTMCNLGEAYRDEYLNQGRIEGSTNMAFKAALSMVEEFHVDFKRALIVLKITDPKEQEFYLKKYEALNSNH